MDWTPRKGFGEFKMVDAKRVKVRAPASSANLGAGFDCLAMALDLWNTLAVETADEFSVECCDGDGCTLPRTRDNLFVVALEAVFGHAGQEPPPLKYFNRQDIPLQRGLGSSAAAIACGIEAGCALLGSGMSMPDKLRLATGIEGHADNVAAALMGGGVVVVEDGGERHADPVPIPEDLNCVVFIPEIATSTSESRGKLPREVGMGDAVHNIGRAALLVNQLNRGETGMLGVAMQDRLHQRHRFSHRGQEAVIKAAVRAGAVGACLSGSGPSVLALAKGREMTIHYEMAEAARLANLKGDVRILKVARSGAGAAA